MKKELLGFLRILLIFSISITIIAFFVFRIMEPAYRTPALPFLIVFFFLATLFFHYIFLNARKKRAAVFVNSFMAITMLKLLLYMIILLGYVFLVNRADAVNFIITFFLFYLFYTVFEVILMMRKAGE